MQQRNLWEKAHGEARGQKQRARKGKYGGRKQDERGTKSNKPSKSTANNDSLTGF
jgi:hypothetical protein